MHVIEENRKDYLVNNKIEFIKVKESTIEVHSSSNIPVARQ